MNIPPRVIWCAVAFASAYLAGCGSTGPTVVDVTGTATRDGKPVPHLFLNFLPDQGRPSWGMTDERGRFTLSHDEKRNGAVVGTHTVWVQWRPKDPGQEQDLALGKAKRPPELSAILAKYGKQDTTPLRIQISRDTREVEVKLD
jgi:hypothetical protein